MHVLPKLMMKMVLVVLTAMLLSVMVAAAEGTSGKVTADALRVRAGASTETEILGMLYNGTVVQLTGEEGDWYTISYNGTTGYLHKDYIQLVEEEAQAAEEEVAEEEIFQIVEEMPSYPGGAEALYEYLNDNIRYPIVALESGISGRVYVQFVVEKDGSVSDVKVLRGIGGGCDEEAIRVVEKMPKWNPGKQRGRAVRVLYMVPINFTLN